LITQESGSDITLLAIFSISGEIPSMSGQGDFFDFLMMFRICFFPVVLKVNALFFKPSLLALLSANWIGLVPDYISKCFKQTKMTESGQ
jgi:hypothetical protein